MSDLRLSKKESVSKKELGVIVCFLCSVLRCVFSGRFKSPGGVAA